MALLKASDLCLSYATSRGPLRAVDGISFAVEGTGEALGIIGETGSGKSSLLYALTRVLPRNVEQYSGKVLFEDVDIMGLTNEQFRRRFRWKKIAVVFQGALNGFNPVIRIGMQLAERLIIEEKVSKGEARAHICQLLEAVGLASEVFDRYPHELSGGMKQRAALAMALSMKPPLVVLDEPTSALDVSVQAQLMNVLKGLKWDRGLSMIFITHDIALASDLSDQIAVMYCGQIREYGSAENVLLHPRDPYTQELLASIPRLDEGGEPRFVGGVPPDPTELQLGCRFSTRCTKKIPRCEQEPPELFQVGSNHVARCWLCCGGNAS